MYLDSDGNFAISIFVAGMVIGGAAGAVAAAGGAFLIGGISSVFSKFTTDLFALTAFGTPIGSWEDYAIAFTFGGLSRGLFGKIPTVKGGVIDAVIRPFANQLTRIGTGRQSSFDVEKYGYDIITRAATYGMDSNWKAFVRGGVRGYWDYYRKGLFN